MANTRTFYAVYQVAIKDNAASPTHNIAAVNAREFPSGWAAAAAVDEVAGKWEVVRGVQTVGVTTNFITEQAFQLGQVELYQVSERQPEIEATLEKVLDGTKPVYFMVTDPAYNTGIVSKLGSYRADVALGIYADTQTRAQNNPKSVQTLSGMYLSSVTYTFPVDGACTEQITLVGNDKLWALLDTSVSGHADAISSASTNAGGDAEAPEGIPLGAFSGLQELAGGTAQANLTTVIGSGVQRRENVQIARSVLPRDIPGCSGAASDTIQASGVGGVSGVTVTRIWANTDNIIEHIQNITVSVDFGREDVFELGSRRPFAKTATFPIQTSCSIEVITAEGDLIDASAGTDCGASALQNNTIIVRTCEGLQVDLGDTMTLESVEQAGAGTDGGNMTVTYNYVGYNVFNVTHDTFLPSHRLYVGATGGSRFNRTS
jgi:hypothetical protein